MDSFVVYRYQIITIEVGYTYIHMLDLGAIRGPVLTFWHVPTKVHEMQNGLKFRYPKLKKMKR